MEIVVAQQVGRIPVTVFQITGDVDTSTSLQVQSQIEQAIQAGAYDIVLDLTAVGYLSSAGIRLLSHLFNLLRGNLPQESDAAMKQGVRDGTFKSPHLKLVSPTPRVADVLKMSGIDMLIESYRSVPEAIASF
jgi:anti-anti-sigma regulatory factor